MTTLTLIQNQKPFCCPWEKWPTVIGNKLDVEVLLCFQRWYCCCCLWQIFLNFRMRASGRRVNNFLDSFSRAKKPDKDKQQLLDTVIKRIKALQPWYSSIACWCSLAVFTVSLSQTLSFSQGHATGSISSKPSNRCLDVLSSISPHSRCWQYVLLFGKKFQRSC